ncbi:hypothetical protein BGZ83_003816 [Gryganskiella cystojenkinii]|nr:hypothetical protein BGZ83_003816 [Gryganskiella cystojenkinii]
MSAPPPPSNNPGFQVGGVGVPGAQVELLESMQPEQHILDQQSQQYRQQQFQQPQQYQQQPQQYQQQPQQYQQQPQQHQQQPQQHQQQPQQQFQQAPVGQQFEQQYQQSFFAQPDMPESRASAVTSQIEMAPPATVPMNTNAVGDGAPGYSVGGLGVPGARVELLPVDTASIPAPGQDAVLGGQLDTVQHASASRPPVGPLDPPAPNAAALAGPPAIQLQRQATVPGHQQQAGLQQTPDSLSSVSTTATTPTTTTAGAPIVHIASESVVAAAAAAHAADAATRGRRRSSLAILSDKIRSATSRSRSPSLSRRLSRTLSRHSIEEGDEEYGQDGATGPYADVKQAQKEYLSKVRADQARNNITTNIDGIPIPPPPESQRRRSSVSHILGFDKPLLSR